MAAKPATHSDLAPLQQALATLTDEVQTLVQKVARLEDKVRHLTTRLNYTKTDAVSPYDLSAQGLRRK